MQPNKKNSPDNIVFNVYPAQLQQCGIVNSNTKHFSMFVSVKLPSNASAVLCSKKQTNIYNINNISYNPSSLQLAINNRNENSFPLGWLKNIVLPNTSQKIFEINIFDKDNKTSDAVALPTEMQERILDYLTNDMTNKAYNCHTFFVYAFYGSNGVDDIIKKLENNNSLLKTKGFFPMPSELEMDVREMKHPSNIEKGDGIIFFQGNETEDFYPVHFAISLGYIADQYLCLAKAGNGGPLMVQTLQEAKKTYNSNVIGYIHKDFKKNNLF